MLQSDKITSAIEKAEKLGGFISFTSQSTSSESVCPTIKTVKGDSHISVGEKTSQAK